MSTHNICFYGELKKVIFSMIIEFPSYLFLCRLYAGTEVCQHITAAHVPDARDPARVTKAKLQELFARWTGQFKIIFLYAAL